jgi:hypothetical protein
VGQQHGACQRSGGGKISRSRMNGRAVQQYFAKNAETICHDFPSEQLSSSQARHARANALNWCERPESGGQELKVDAITRRRCGAIAGRFFKTIFLHGHPIRGARRKYAQSLIIYGVNLHF